MGKQMVMLAEKTLNAIDRAIENDQGGRFREKLKEIILSFDDVYRNQEFPFRKHLGASRVGSECARKIWYSFRWFKNINFNSRLLRLFNRGHLEEARFVAMLMVAGVDVRYESEEGGQFKISNKNSHFEGSCDGIAYKVPDLDSDEPCLLEYKTMNANEFEKLLKSGVKQFKNEHYVQMQVYMHKLKLKYALYLAVNKNDDEIYAEIIEHDATYSKFYIERGELIILKDTPPNKMSNSPGWYACKFCDYHAICHLEDDYNKNCRTCSKSRLLKDGEWECSINNKNLDLHSQLKGCFSWDKLIKD